jgi:hypothetical protein
MPPNATLHIGNKNKATQHYGTQYKDTQMDRQKVGEMDEWMDR